MLVLFLTILFSFTSSYWSYVPEGVLGLADGDLQIRRFAHPPDEQDFAWHIGDNHHHYQLDLFQSDPQSSIVAQTQQSQTSSFQQPLTFSSEILEQILNDYPEDLINQPHQLTGDPWINSGNHREDDPHQHNSGIHLPQQENWAEYFHHPSDSVPIVHTEINHFNPPNHIVPNYQHMNGQTGNFWTQPLLQDQSIEGSNLPRSHISSPGREENLINGIVENNHLIKPSNVPNVFGNNISSNNLSSRVDSIHDTESNWIQDFENNNHGGPVDHEKLTLGLPGVNFFHGNHMNHPNYGPGGFGEKNVFDHSSPESDINFEIFLNNLIHSPPHLVQENENGDSGFVKSHESDPLGVVTQSAHSKNFGFEVEKTLKSDSNSDAPVSNDPLSAIEKIRGLIPNLKPHNNYLYFNPDIDILGQSGGFFLNNVASLSSQEKSEHENNMLMEERTLSKKRKHLDPQRFGVNNIQDLTPQFESFRKYIEENLEPGSSDSNSQSTIIELPKNLNPRENRKLKNRIDPISQEPEEFKTDPLNNGKKPRIKSRKSLEKSGEKIAGSKKRNEQIYSYQKVNSKSPRLGFFGRHHVVEEPSKITAESMFLKEVKDWEMNVFKKPRRVVNANFFFPKKFSTTGRKKPLISAENYATNNIFYNSEIGEVNNIKDKQLQDLITEGNILFNSIFFQQIIEKVKRIDDIFLKSALVTFFVPIRERLVQKKTDVFFIPTDEVSSFFHSGTYLRLDNDKYDKLLQEGDSEKVESEVFKLPKKILDWIENLSKQSKSYQTNRFVINKISWSKRKLVITDIRRKFLENSFAIIKVLGNSEEEIINQFKKKRDRAVEIIDDILVNVDFRSGKSRDIKIETGNKESDLNINKAINKAGNNLMSENTRNQGNKEILLTTEKEQLIKILSDYFKRNILVYYNRVPIVTKIILYWLKITHESILSKLNIEPIGDHQKIFLTFWKRFFSIIRMLDHYKYIQC
ncbi:hypothetical protein PPACK8108_LOCUS1081 [Phakopsora pachyrhizi]|uniref:Uncharacterized protein n=1 Tax=Phakopsora pachyrhizi TaxID=170000 RepID=A0AAV0AF35_PHAPC|nr:hypothetical protein PPACK8108_LOCUS1081 [Phakopsora pachyrhizi]